MDALRLSPPNIQTENSIFEIVSPSKENMLFGCGLCVYAYASLFVFKAAPYVFNAAP